jgi:LacI family transcriptional regulator
VVGFDDMPWAISLRPPLTVVAQPIEEIGRVAAELLLERLKAPDQMIRQVVLSTRLIVRASCGDHAVAPPLVTKNLAGGEVAKGQLSRKNSMR